MTKMTTRTIKLNAYRNSTITVNQNLRKGSSTPNFKWQKLYGFCFYPFINLFNVFYVTN
jgi:hypothetical protein